MTRIDEIIKLRKEGKLLREIGAIYNITRERVRQILNKQNIRGRVRPSVLVPKTCPTCGKVFMKYIVTYCGRKCFATARKAKNREMKKA